MWTLTLVLTCILFIFILNNINFIQGCPIQRSWFEWGPEYMYMYYLLLEIALISVFSNLIIVNTIINFGEIVLQISFPTWT